nr:MAG TPA: hypothetical protein [Caudoviricetes sp.]
MRTRIDTNCKHKETRTFDIPLWLKLHLLRGK